MVARHREYRPIQIAPVALGVVLAGLVVTIGCGTDPIESNDDQNSTDAAQIDEFAVLPELAAVDQDVEFSWSVSGEIDRCVLDVTGDGDSDHEVDDCSGADQFDHAYPDEGVYDVSLRAIDGDAEAVDERTATVEVVDGEAPKLNADFENHEIIQNSIADPVEISEGFVIEGTELTPTEELQVSASSSDDEVLSSDDISLDCDDQGECSLAFEIPRPDQLSAQVLVTVEDDSGLSSGASISASVEPRWVLSPENTGSATLREKVSMADDGDYIGFDFDGAATITLQAEVEIDTDVHIVGPGSDELTIDGQEETRIFRISDGTVVDISGMAMRRGLAPEDENGGAVYNNDGTLVLDGVLIEDSVADGEGGGALYSNGFTELTDSVVEGNYATFGGAIQNDGTLEIAETLFKDNAANATGGAIYQGGGGLEDDGQLVVRDSAFVANHAGNHGGGVLNDDDEGKIPMTFVNTTFTDNVVTSSGAAIFNLGQLDVSFSTIVGNVVEDDESGFGNHRGGGIRASGSGSMRMKATIVADNETPASEVDVSGEIASLGFNFIGDPDGFEAASGEPFMETDVTEVTSPVGELGDHGGPTPSMLPDSDSPVVDHIPDDDCLAIGAPALTRDQRDESRPGGDGEFCDSGSVELQ